MNDNLLIDTQYHIPEKINVVVNSKCGDVIKNENAEIKPIDLIKKRANELGIKLNGPKPNCKKCYGRGYTAWYAKTKEPVLCKCLFKK